MRILTIILLILSFSALAEEKVSFSDEITPKSLASLEQKILKVVSKFKPDAPRVVVLDLSSGGGNLYATLSFIGQIQKAAADQKFTLITRNRNSCESSCTVLYTAGSIRQASKYAQFGFHSPAIASKLPKGVKRDDVLREARERWMAAITKVDPLLSLELDHRGYFLHDDMSYMSGRDLATGYVSEIIK